MTHLGLFMLKASTVCLKQINYFNKSRTKFLQGDVKNSLRAITGLIKYFFQHYQAVFFIGPSRFGYLLPLNTRINYLKIAFFYSLELSVLDTNNIVTQFAICSSLIIHEIVTLKIINGFQTYFLL